MDMTIGEKLRQARQDHQLTLEQVAEELHIKPAYLRALEENALERIPSRPQARGFLRLYANRLGVDLTPASPPAAEQIAPEPEVSVSDPAEPDTAESLSWQLAFAEIGDTLRTRRDLLGLSPAEIEAHTRIPEHYLAYIEAGDFDRFPSPAQARGMLSNYVNFLDLKPDPIMQKYADALQSRLTARQEVAPIAIQPRPRPRRETRAVRLPDWVRLIVSPDLVLISSLGLLVVVLTIWGIGRVTRTSAEQVPLPTAPSLANALLPTATPPPTLTPTTQAPVSGAIQPVEEQAVVETSIPTVQVAAGSSLQVFIVARQRTFLRVTVDGTVAYEGRTEPGDSLTFNAQNQVQLLTGNAAALQVYYNNQDTGVLGIFGEVVEIIYTRDGIIRPTQAPTPTLRPDQITPSPTTVPTESGSELPPSQSTPVP
jgi:cytoskeletal protein RodZ